MPDKTHEQVPDTNKPTFYSEGYNVITPDNYSSNDNNIYGDRDLFKEIMDRRNAGMIAHEFRDTENNSPYFNREYLGRGTDVPEWLANVSQEHIERVGEENQSWHNKLKNGFMQFTGGAVSGFVESFTSMADVFRHGTGNYAYDPDSIIDNAMDDMNEAIARRYRIFGANHRGFNWSYASNLLGSAGTTAGMVAGNALIEGAIAALIGGGAVTGGTSTALGVSLQAARLATIGRLAAKLGRRMFYATQTAAMNSRESAKAVYEEALMKYGDKELAKQMATDQGNRDFYLQTAYGFAAGHIVERAWSRGLGRWLAKKSGFDVAMERMTSKPGLRGYGNSLAKNVFTQGLSEGGQEAGEEIISEYTKEWTLFHGGILRPANWDNIYDSFIAGAVMGAVGGLFHTRYKPHQQPHKPSNIPQQQERELLALPPSQKALPPYTRGITDGNKPIVNEVPRPTNPLLPPSSEGVQKDPKLLEQGPPNPLQQLFDLHSNPYDKPRVKLGVEPANHRLDEALDKVDSLRAGSINENYNDKPSEEKPGESGLGITTLDSNEDKDDGQKDLPKETKTQEENDDDINNPLEEDISPIHGEKDNPISNKRKDKKDLPGSKDILQEEKTETKDQEDKDKKDKQDKGSKEVKDTNSKDKDKERKDKEVKDTGVQEDGTEEGSKEDKQDKDKQDKDKSDKEKQEGGLEQVPSETTKEVKKRRNRLYNEEAEKKSVVDKLPKKTTKKPKVKKVVSQPVPANEQVPVKKKKVVSKGDVVSAPNANESDKKIKHTEEKPLNKKTINFISSAFDSAVSSILSLYNRILKDVNSIKLLSEGKTIGETLQIIDNVIDSLKQKGGRFSTGNPELDKLIDEISNEIDAEIEDYINFLESYANTLRDLVAKAYDGDNKVVSDYETKRKAMYLAVDALLKAKLKEINNQLSRTKKLHKDGYINKAIAYLSKKFSFSGIIDIGENEQVSHMVNYLTYQKRAIKALLKENAEEFKRGDGLGNTNTLDDLFDILNGLPTKQSVKEAREHFFMNKEANDVTMPSVNKVDSNISEQYDKPSTGVLFNGNEILDGVPNDYLKRKVSKFMYNLHRFYNAGKDAVLAAIAKEKMLQEFMRIKHALEYRYNREISNQEVLRFIYNNDLSGLEIGAEEFRAVYDYIDGTEDFSFDENRGGAVASEVKHDPVVSEMEQEVLTEQNPIQRTYNVIVSYIDANIDKLNTKKKALALKLKNRILKNISSETFNKKHLRQISLKFMKVFGLKAGNMHIILNPNYDPKVNSEKDMLADNPNTNPESVEKIETKEVLEEEEKKDKEGTGKGRKKKRKGAGMVIASGYEVETLGDKKPKTKKEPKHKKPARRDHITKKPIKKKSKPVENLDDSTLHLSDVEVPINKAVPDPSIVEYGKDKGKKKLVNRVPVNSTYKHYRKLDNGKWVELPVTFKANENTRKLLIGLMRRLKDLGLLGKIDAIFLFSDFIELNTDTYQIKQSSDGLIYYEDKITGQQHTGFPPVDMLVPSYGFYEDVKNGETIYKGPKMSDFIQEELGISAKEYMDSIAHTKYHTVVVNGNPQTIFDSEEISDNDFDINETEETEGNENGTEPTFSEGDEDPSSMPSTEHVVEKEDVSTGQIEGSGTIVISNDDVSDDSHLKAELMVFSVKRDFFGKLVIPDVVKQIAGKNVSRKELKALVREAIKRHSKVIEDAIKSSNDRAVKMLGKDVLDKIKGTIIDGIVNDILDSKLDDVAGEGFDSNGSDFGFDTNANAILSSIQITDTNDKGMTTPLGLPAYHKIGDVRKVLFTAIDNANGRLDSYEDLRDAILDIQDADGLVKDIINTLDNLPEWAINRLMFKLRGAVQQRSLHIDANGNVQDADKQGGIFQAIQNLFAILRSKLSRGLSKAGNVLLNRKNYNVIMRGKQYALSSSQGFIDLALARFEAMRQKELIYAQEVDNMPEGEEKERLKKGYRYKNAKNAFYNLFSNPATMIASWLNKTHGVVYNSLDIIGALKVFGYNIERNEDSLNDVEATKDINGTLFYFTDQENKELQQIHMQIHHMYYGTPDISTDMKNVRPRSMKTFSPQEIELEHRLQARLREIINNKIKKSGVDVVKIDNGRTFYTLANKNKGSQSPFDVVKITGLLNSIGIDVSHDAVDKFFNKEVMTDADGREMDYSKLVAIAQDPNHEDHEDAVEDLNAVMKLIERKVMFLQHIIVAPSNLNDTVVNGTVSAMKGITEGGTSGMVSNDAAYVHLRNELFRLYGYHYRNRVGGTRAGSMVGKTSNVNYVSSNAINDILQDIKANPKSYRDKPLLKGNMAIGVVNDNTRAMQEMRVDSVHTDVNTKLAGNDNTILKSSPADRNKAYLSFYYSENFGGYEYDHPVYGRVKMRTMQGPVMSDKNQALLFTLPTLVINENEIVINNDEGIVYFSFDNQPDDRIKHIITNQLFVSELRRVLAFRRTDKNINRKSQREGGKYFYTFPEFNEMTDGEGISILAFIDANPNMSEEELISVVMERYGDRVYGVIENQINNNIDYLLSKQVNLNRLIEERLVRVHGKMKEYGMFFDSSTNKVIYNRDGSLAGFEVIGEDGEKIVILATDDDIKKFNEFKEFVHNRLTEYVVNNMLATNTIHNVFLGDVSIFSNVKKATKSDGTINFKKLVRDAIINSFKRWAGAIGSTKKVSDDPNETYHQIVLDDVIGVASNIDTHIKFNYPNMPNEDRDKILALRKEYNPVIAGEMIEKYPKIAAELEVTTTDAQEYITWQEAIHIMKSSGTLTEEQADKLQGYYDKLSRGEKLSDKEVEDFNNSYEYMMNAHKPLAGQTMDIRGDGDKVIGTGFNYVKTSAVVLLPQFTKGSKLDNLRKMMERTGDGRTRATFVSGMKADTVAKPLNMNEIDTDGNVAQGRAEEVTIQMRRKGWGIQSNMVNHLQEDVLNNKTKPTITLSTQQQSIMFDAVSGKGYKFKLRTGKDIIEEFNRHNPSMAIKDSGNVTAEQLRALYAFAVEKLLSISSQKVYNKLGANLKNLTRLIADTLSASNPNSPLIRIIEQSSVHDLINHSDEQVRNIVHSFIQKALGSVKVHGTSLLTMSSAGLELNGTSETGDIVYVGDYNPADGLRGARIDDNGKFHPAEVLIPSYFTKINADGSVEIIDLTSDKYSYRDENGHLRLREGVIEGELLVTNSPRIPYSNINSGSSYKIVGFLPRHMANSAIIPDSIIVQKGSDNDGDKEFMPFYNYHVTEEGNIVRDDVEGTAEAYENLILDVTNAVYHSPNEGVQKEIIKPISSAPIKDTLSKIEEAREGSSNDITSYTDIRFADNNASSGQSGKLGVGYYSSESIRQSALSTQSKNSEPIILHTPFGPLDMSSDAEGELSKADMISIMQNESVDNAKNNNLGLINGGNVTQAIYSGLIHLGFNGKEGKTGMLNAKASDGKSYNLPMLMMSLPVVSHIIQKFSELEIVGRDTIVDVMLEIDADIEDRKIFNVMRAVNPVYEHGMHISYDNAVKSGYTELAEFIKNKYNEVKGRKVSLESYAIKVTGKDLGLLNRTARGDVKYDGTLRDVKYQQDYLSYKNIKEKLGSMIDEILTPDVLLALHEGRNEVDGKKIDVVLANRLVMAKMMLAHKANRVVNEASSLINKTHSIPSTLGQTGRKMFDIYTGFTSGSLSLAGDYKISEGVNHENPYDVVMDILYNIKPTTPEGVRLVSSIKALLNIYDNVFPEYHMLLQLGLNTISDTKNVSDVEKYLDSLVEDYTLYRRTAMFADSKEELDALTDYVFKGGVIEYDKEELDENGNPIEKAVGKGYGNLAKQISERKSSSGLWQTNKVLSSIGINLDQDASRSIYLSNVGTNLDELMEGFIDLIHDNDTTLFEDNAGRKITPRKFAFLLAFYANMTGDKKMLHMIPSSFYEALNKQSAGSIEEFYSQYIRNNYSHLMTIDSINHAMPVYHFGDYAKGKDMTPEFTKKFNKNKQSFHSKIYGLVGHRGGLVFNEHSVEGNVLKRKQEGGQPNRTGGSPLEISRLGANAKRGKAFIIKTPYPFGTTIKKFDRKTGQYESVYQKYTETRLVVQHEDGSFKAADILEDKEFKSYNSLESQGEFRKGIVMPKSMDNIKSIQSINANDVSDRVVNDIILKDTNLTPEQKAPLKFIADNARFDLVDDNGRKIATGKEGVYNIPIPYNNGDLQSVYGENDSVDKRANINKIKREMYKRYAEFTGQADVEGYVNDMMTPREVEEVEDNVLPLQEEQKISPETKSNIPVNDIIDDKVSNITDSNKADVKEDKLDGIDENNKCK